MNLFLVDDHYLAFLQNYKKQQRGFSKVPNANYINGNNLTLGVVVTINQLNYFVAVSAFKIKQQANLLIIVKEDKTKVKGSLRFNFMFPVPTSCLTKLSLDQISDLKLKTLISKELEFCVNNEERIKRQAIKIYQLVTTKQNSLLLDNSCDFNLLEQGYDLYQKLNSFI